MLDLKYYREFQKSVDHVKNSLTSFLLQQKREGKNVVGYGAAAKGNTLMNYCGIKKDLIPFVVDASPHKQGKYLPGSHIPVVDKEEIEKLRPDFLLILPWNLKEEIIQQLAYVREWGAQFVIPIPEVHIL